MSDFIDAYCERLDAGFWSEPLNAVTNAAFILAALLLIRQPLQTRDWPLTLLVGLVFAIGVGSFLFHTHATRWAALADVIPIVLFMLGAVALGLMRRFQARWWVAAVGVIGFLASAIPLTSPALAQWVPNGSSAYLPALLTLGLFALFLARIKDAYAVFFIAAALIFAISLTLRTIDLPLCEHIPAGTHFLWHILNAVTLFLVCRGLEKSGQPGRQQRS